MLLKSSVISLAVAMLIPIAPVMAQGVQQWDANQANQVMQGAATGALSQQQASNFANRDAMIMQQQNMYRAQNGGHLTGAESQQIRNELAHVQNGINRDMSRNTGMGYGTGYGYTPVNYAGYNNNGYLNNQYMMNRAIQQPNMYNNNWGYRHHWNNSWH